MQNMQNWQIVQPKMQYIFSKLESKYAPWSRQMEWWCTPDSSIPTLRPPSTSLSSVLDDIIVKQKKKEAVQKLDPVCVTSALLALIQSSLAFASDGNA